MKRLQRISENIRQLGWIDGLIFLAAIALSRISGRRAKIVRYYLVAQPVPVVAHSTHRPSQSRVTFVEAVDPLVDQFPRSPDVIARRFRNGAQCLAARQGERFAGFLWLARAGYDEDTVRCRYEFVHPDQSAWDFDVYVEPDFRIGRTFARLWDTANGYMASEGVRWTYSRIGSSNPGSLLSHRRLGIRRLFSATFICFGALQITVAGAAPFLHISLSRGTRPTFRLSPPEGG